MPCRSQCTQCNALRMPGIQYKLSQLKQQLNVYFNMSNVTYLSAFSLRMKEKTKAPKNAPLKKNTTNRFYNRIV